MTAHKVIFFSFAHHYLSFRTCGNKIAVKVCVFHLVGFLNKKLFNIFLKIYSHCCRLDIQSAKNVFRNVNKFTVQGLC